MLIQEKVNQARGLLREFDIDCWITFARESQINGDPTLAFLVNADITWHSAFIICKDGSTHAIVGEYDRLTVAENGAWDEVVGFVKGIREPLQSYLKSKDPARIAVNYSKGSEICDGLTHGMYLTLYELLQEIGFEQRLISAEPIVSALRERKTATEVEYMRAAVRETEKIFAAVAGFISPGRTEKEIAAFMKKQAEDARLELSWEPMVCPAVFTGPETAQAHYAPSDRRVERGQILNMDFGVKVKGYCSDMQRTFYILGPDETDAPGEVKRGFATVVNAVESARQAIRPGREGHEIDAVARTIIVDAGYDEFPHGLGHQVGRFSHDGTALLGPPWEKYAGKPFRKLERGMVFTIEPRLTVPNRGVATIEEMVVITGDGAEYLTHPQKELILIKG
jgi:Xaa-Pro aminopeptidase